jgi:hypothetical protein
MAYALGKYAQGICDRCGFQYPYLDLREEWNKFKVCPECYEPKARQLEPTQVGADPEALYQPRPDIKSTTDVTITFPILNTNTFKLEPLLPVLNTQVGTVTFGGNVTTPVTGNPTGVSATGSVGTVTASGTGTSIAATYTVTVASYLGANKYYINGTRQDTVSLSEGSTYRFDQSDSSNSGHPLRLSATSDGTHGGGSQYTTGVTTSGTPGSSGAYTQITVASGAPTLYYYCTNHSGMGGQANTP